MGFAGVQLFKSTGKYKLSTTLKVFKQLFKLLFKDAEAKQRERKIPSVSHKGYLNV